MTPPPNRGDRILALFEGTRPPPGWTLIEDLGGLLFLVRIADGHEDLWGWTRLRLGGQHVWHSGVPTFPPVTPTIQGEVLRCATCGCLSLAPLVACACPAIARAELAEARLAELAP